MKKDITFQRCLTLLVALLLVSPGFAAAEELAPSTVAPVVVAPATPVKKPLPDRFMLRMGGYHARDANTVLRLDAKDAPLGTTIDFAKNLGGDTETTVGRVDALYRFNDTHALAGSWYSLNFEGTKAVDKEIQWGDNVLNVSARLDSDIEFDIYKLSYQYSLFHNDKAELGASFGFHVMQTSVSMAGTINTVAGSSTTKSITAPLPVWGLFANYDFTPKLKTYYSYQVFNINYDDKVKGGLQDFLLGLEYRVIPNVGLGVAYNRFSANLEIEQDASTLFFDTNWNGGMLYGSVYF